MIASMLDFANGNHRKILLGKYFIEITMNFTKDEWRNSWNLKWILYLTLTLNSILRAVFIILKIDPA